MHDVGQRINRSLAAQNARTAKLTGIGMAGSTMPMPRAGAGGSGAMPGPAGLAAVLTAMLLEKVTHKDSDDAAPTGTDPSATGPDASGANTSPNTPGPDDEEHKVNSDSGKEKDPSDKSGEYPRAGRALQKHGSREGSAFPKPKGNPSQMNEQGQQVLDRITNSPNARIEPGNRFGGVDVYHQNGMGARFDAGGTFRGFLEPPR